MRAAAILGLGSSPRDLLPFQSGLAASWTIGMPGQAADADVILIFGGDGTLHRHLPQLARLGLPVMIVPAGSGNDFARALDITNLKAALAAWQKLERGEGNVRLVDLGTITELEPAALSSHPPVTPAQPWEPHTRHYFACVASCGLDAAVARRAGLQPRWIRAHGGYALSLPGVLARYHPVNIETLLSDPNRAGCFAPFHSGPTMAVACANTPVYGGGIRIAPQAQMDDGRLDVCHIKPLSRLKLLSIFPTAYLGRHLAFREVEYVQSEKVRLLSATPTSVYADGEYVCETPVEVGIAPRILTVVVP
jgi:diacylglycerol kinase (ATP)